jgi:hypothetical protein
MNAYSTHNDVTALGFCCCRKEKNKKEAGAGKQAEADFIKNPYTIPIAALDGLTVLSLVCEVIAR